MVACFLSFQDRDLRRSLAAHSLSALSTVSLMVSLNKVNFCCICLKSDVFCPPLHQDNVNIPPRKIPLPPGKVKTLCYDFVEELMKDDKNSSMTTYTCLYALYAAG